MFAVAKVDNMIFEYYPYL